MNNVIVAAAFLCFLSTTVAAAERPPVLFTSGQIVWSAKLVRGDLIIARWVEATKTFVPYQPAARMSSADSSLVTCNVWDDHVDALIADLGDRDRWVLLELTLERGQWRWRQRQLRSKPPRFAMLSGAESVALPGETSIDVFGRTENCRTSTPLGETILDADIRGNSILLGTLDGVTTARLGACRIDTEGSRRIAHVGPVALTLPHALIGVQNALVELNDDMTPARHWDLDAPVRDIVRFGDAAIVVCSLHFYAFRRGELRRIEWVDGPSTPVGLEGDQAMFGDSEGIVRATITSAVPVSNATKFVWGPGGRTLVTRRDAVVVIAIQIAIVAAALFLIVGVARWVLLLRRSKA